MIGCPAIRGESSRAATGHARPHFIAWIASVNKTMALVSIFCELLSYLAWSTCGSAHRLEGRACWSNLSCAGHRKPNGGPGNHSRPEYEFGHGKSSKITVYGIDLETCACLADPKARVCTVISRQTIARAHVEASQVIWESRPLFTRAAARRVFKTSIKPLVSANQHH